MSLPGAEIASSLSISPSATVSQSEELLRSLSNPSNSILNSHSVPRQSPARRGRKPSSAFPPSCNIAPKQDTTIITSGSADGPHMARIRSSDGSSKEVGVLKKLPSSSPIGRTGGNSSSTLQSRPAKQYCQLCNLCPKGFRGEHELQRHYNLRHSPVKTFWICVDPTPDGTALSKCHHCMSEKKYGQYYNAAAHLRRVHFNPRRRGRKSKKQTEKRGGSAGGKNPPMDELKKNWMKQIEVREGDDGFYDELDEDIETKKSLVGGDRKKKDARQGSSRKDVKHEEQEEASGDEQQLPQFNFFSNPSRGDPGRFESWCDASAILQGVGAGQEGKITNIEGMDMDISQLDPYYSPWSGANQ